MTQITQTTAQETVFNFSEFLKNTLLSEDVNPTNPVGLKEEEGNLEENLVVFLLKHLQETLNWDEEKIKRFLLLGNQQAIVRLPDQMKRPSGDQRIYLNRQIRAYFARLDNEGKFHDTPFNAEGVVKYMADTTAAQFSIHDKNGKISDWKYTILYHVLPYIKDIESYGADKANELFFDRAKKAHEENQESEKVNVETGPTDPINPPSTDVTEVTVTEDQHEESEQE